MKPVAIFQHEADTPAGYFDTWLRAQPIPHEVVRIDRDEPVPAGAHAFSGLCFMGGSMSVNDPLPWIADELALIRDADATGVPVIGHCLGGQLLARALGGCVKRNAVKEIGWHAVSVTDADLAKQWLGEQWRADGARGEALEFFQWHGDTFELPPDARNFLGSRLCGRQAFVIERRGFAHLGMQFHCEMTPALIDAWTRSGAAEISAERAATGGPGVQPVEEMLANSEQRVTRMHALSARFYERWAAGLRT